MSCYLQENLDVVAERLSLDPGELLVDPHSYVVRFGEYKAPFQVAVKVAERCCQRFTWDVLRCIQAEEDEQRSHIITGRRPLLDDEWWISCEVSCDWVEGRLKE